MNKSKEINYNKVIALDHLCGEIKARSILIKSRAHMSRNALKNLHPVWHNSFLMLKDATFLDSMFVVFIMRTNGWIKSEEGRVYSRAGMLNNLRKCNQLRKDSLMLNGDSSQRIPVIVRSKAGTFNSGLLELIINYSIQIFKHIL